MSRFFNALGLFAIVTILGIVIRYVFGEESAIWGFWNAVDVSFAVALGVLAFLAYREMMRDEDEIRLFFDVEGQKVDTGLCLLRKDCTRSEIIGVLGMMQKRNNARFIYDAIHLHDLLNEINSVQKSKRKTLYVPLTKEEFEQFALSKEGR